MAELTPELYQQVRDLSRFKRDFTLDEIGRRAGIAAAIAGGMDPRQAREYYFSQSPYRLTRSEFKDQLNMIIELARLQAESEAAARKGDKAARDRAIKLGQELAKAQVTAAGRQGDKYAAEDAKRLSTRIESIDSLIDAERRGSPPDISAGLTTALLQLRNADASTNITEIIEDPTYAPQFRDFADSVATLKGKSLQNYMDEIASRLNAPSGETVLAQLESVAGPPFEGLMNLYGQNVKDVLSPEELQELEAEKQGLVDELRQGTYRGGGTAQRAVEAATQAGKDIAGGAQPSTDTMGFIKQALTELPEEGPPIRMERERLQRGPEFQKFMEEFYGRSAEDRPFSDIEERGALRAARLQARKQARSERQERRQRLGALRRGEEFVAEETVQEEPAETTEKAPSKSAQLPVPAAAEATTATGVGEQPDINAYSFTEFDIEGDPFLYRVTKDGEFQSKRRGAKNFISYTANPYAEGGLVDKINAAAVAPKKSDDRAALEMSGDTFSPEVSKSIFEVDILTRPKETPTVQDRARQRARDAYSGVLSAAPSGAVSMPRRVDKALRQQRTREELLDPRTQFLGAPEEIEFEGDAQEAVDFTPGTEEDLAESAEEIAKAQAEVFDTPADNPMRTPLSDAPPTANEVLKANLEAAGETEEVYGDGEGLVGESPAVILENEKRKQLLRRMRP
tara:strand:+ start:1548 stop:3599 length:2052 start_codon:yes stop_codon:yes gene_type:complete